MKERTSRKRTTTRTRGSKATIKSRVDQWITKRNTGNSWGMGGMRWKWSSQRGNWDGHTRSCLLPSTPAPSYLPVFSLISSPSSLVETLTLEYYSLAAFYGGIGPWWRRDRDPEFSTVALQGPMRTGERAWGICILNALHWPALDRKWFGGMQCTQRPLRSLSPSFVTRRIRTDRFIC